MATCKERIDITTDYSKPYSDWQADESAQMDKWAKRFRSENAGDLVGEVIRFPVADGYGMYMVHKQKPLTLVHVNVGDGYGVADAHIRGLRLADVREQVEGERKLKELFKPMEVVS